MSKVTIQGDASGTGIFTITSPNSNTDRTLVLPDEAGTVLTTAGVPASAMPAGSVLQVVSVTKTDTFTTTSTSYTTITGMTVTVTPSSVSNKVLVSFNLNAGVAGAAGAIRIYRNETAIAIGNAISEPADNRMTVNVYNGGDDSNSTPNFCMSVLDTPNTTSATTYTLRAGCVQGGGIIVVNDQTSQVRNQNYSATTASTITAMEIAG